MFGLSRASTLAAAALAGLGSINVLDDHVETPRRRRAVRSVSSPYGNIKRRTHGEIRGETRELAGIGFIRRRHILEFGNVGQAAIALQDEQLAPVKGTGVDHAATAATAASVEPDPDFSNQGEGGNPHAHGASPWRVGAQVTWTSSNTTKVGEITHVVPAGSLPLSVGAKLKDAGSPRDHVSYVVRGSKLEVGGKPASRKETYWPRVSLLTAL